MIPIWLDVERINPVTVKDMYKYSQENQQNLLPTFNAPFWGDYNSNPSIYDRQFAKMYKNFCYFDQDKDEVKTDEGVSIVTTDFKTDVYNILHLNRKKYEELYRIQVMADNAYGITDDYDVTEIMDKSTTDNSTNQYGSRSDSENTTYGSRTDTSTETLGSHTDTNQTTKGQHTDTSTESVAGFNSSGYENSNQYSDQFGSRTDNSSTEYGAKNNSYSTIQGQQADTKSLVKGQHTDTLDNEGTEEYTLTKKGRVNGNAATNIKKHESFWTPWQFYQFIFNDIAKELLLINAQSIYTVWYW